jgi:GNAT superfamily N-acetyltransferase
MVGVPIRGFVPSDAAFIRSLIARQGWNGGRHDPETFAAADPEAWLIAEVDGTPVGVTLATAWNDAFGWIGVYLVDQDHRGRGIGFALFTRALERLAPRSVGLDGDPAQQANYRRSGFVDVHPNTRWHGPAGAWGAAPAGVLRVADVSFDDLVALDARAVGSERRGLLQAWIDQPEAVSVAVVDDGVTGFATARPASDGWRIGPVHALGAGAASAAIAGAVAHLSPDTTCWFDTPDPNEEALVLLGNRGYESSPTSGRMARGSRAPADVSVAFALMAHEVG